MIEIKNLVKSYKQVKVLDIPHLKISKGESIGLVGNNGAGKTTLFSLMLDLILPDQGAIYLKDILVMGHDEWKGFTSSFLDDSFLIGYLKPEEYFYFLGELRGLNKQDVDVTLAKYEDFFNGEVIGKRAYIRDLSKGNQKKVGIIGALIGNPELIILDEPFANLDPSTQFRLRGLINALRAEREVTLLISSHDLSHTVEISDRIIALDKGEIIKDMEKNEETLVELNAYFQQD
ncbi:ABC transporter ATP-binding protein [Sphingobacterium lactis]|uniref:ABC transporter ATP-binding protein n=1 Tax=Sphingobacterium lactis TaxID=797291 RepID=UPI003EC7C028